MQLPSSFQFIQSHLPSNTKGLGITTLSKRNFFQSIGDYFAEKSGKNTNIARGMVDEELSFEFLVINGDSLKVDDIEGRKEGKLITLTTELALKYNIADGKSESVEELLSDLGIEFVS